MRNLHVFYLGILVMLFFVQPASAQKNVAYQDGQVRISLITDGIVRLEFVPDGKFVDNRSFVASERNYLAVDFKVKQGSKEVTITTSSMVIRYKKNTGRFTKENLQITSPKKVQTPSFSWYPGLKDTQNLKGTYWTLDDFNGNVNRQTGEVLPLEDGLLSKSGWTLIDDSQSYLFDNSDWPWVMERPELGKMQDLYFMAYGHQYKKALKDFTQFAGKVPLPPRFAFGYWWSRWWSYSDNELRDLVDNFHNYGIPLDVLVVDMDWHYSLPPRGSWTGYTWNRWLFPNPKGFIQWVKSNDLKLTFNLHPREGVKTYEKHWPEMSQWMGIDTLLHKDIKWETGNKHFVEGWINTQLRPMEKNGVDFWWLDWQDQVYDSIMPRLNCTWWINYFMFTDMQRNRTTRPLLYHRWGGLGNHRYQIGFSGDHVCSWKSLDYQPYFNATASNVLYGYWSHDLGGFYGSKMDPELHIRWLQFGLFSAIFRTHSTKAYNFNKEPWSFEQKYFKIIRDIVNERYAWSPYIYTMARKDYETAVSLCRPMYYDYPENQEAYEEKNEYMFGDNLLVYPITVPMKDGKSVKQVWLPAGNDWYELTSGTLLKGGQRVERSFHLDEMPAYLKAGSIIPMYGKVKNLNRNDEPVIVTIAPDSKQKSVNEFTLYEDNGNDKNYATEFATTNLKAEKNDNQLKVTIAARQGSYQNMPANRKFSVKVLCSAVPADVIVDGKKCEWHYEGNELTLYIDIPETDCAKKKVVTITYPQDSPVITDGLLGQIHRMVQNVSGLKQVNARIKVIEGIGMLESTGRAITYNPEDFNSRIALFRNYYQQLPQLLKDQGLKQDAIDDFLLKTY
jgi:alpha-glucosidase (family GH31 glycosyl hydrolase)